MKPRYYTLFQEVIQESEFSILICDQQSPSVGLQWESIIINTCTH